MNRLKYEKSIYLQHASHQKIDWIPWSEEAFERARREDKPVFLSSGAIWCHWCHVMARECFDDEDVARLLNEHFIAIKLDRDERPDIDRLYQYALAAMGQSGGWPLSIFLTPDKKPFYGGTYFPLEDRFGKPGFKRILEAIAMMYKEKKGEIIEHSSKIMEFIGKRDYEEGEISSSIITEGKNSILSAIDTKYGGFGTKPKFPMSGALEFLLNRYALAPDEFLENALKITLRAMARGGYHDQLRGGFHRYSTDPLWMIPHFEKITDDNAWLLRNYGSAYSLFGDEYFKEVAMGIMTFMKDELGDKDGGFYASQDADVTPDDEGGYFTWTKEELRGLLDDEDYRVLSLHLLDEKGVMHHDGRKMVLCHAMDAEEIAQKLSMDVEKVKTIIRNGKKRLLFVREKREKPIIDKALYTSTNGMAISAFLKVYPVLKDRAILDFALKSLDRIMTINIKGDGVFHSEGVEGMFDDYTNLVDALIGAYETTGNPLYLEKAAKLTDLSIERFWDTEGAGFFDTREGVIGMRLKTIEDSPHPSANNLAAINLVRLFHMTGTERYMNYAESTLKAFSPSASLLGPYGGYYFCGLDTFFNTVKLNLYLSPESPLAFKSRAFKYPYKAFVYNEDKGHIIPCVKNVCYEPLYSEDGLRDFFLKRAIPTSQ